SFHDFRDQAANTIQNHLPPYAQPPCTIAQMHLPKNLHFPPSICLRTDNRNPPCSIARRSERRTRTRALRCAKSAEPCATTWPVLSATLNFPCLTGSLVGSKTAPCVLLGTKAVTCAYLPPPPIQCCLRSQEVGLRNGDGVCQYFGYWSLTIMKSCAAVCALC